MKKRPNPKRKGVAPTQPRRKSSPLSTARSTAALVAAIMAHGANAQIQPGIVSTNSPATNSPTALPEVRVQGRHNAYKTDNPALPRLTEPLRETPQSITVVPRELMDDQGVGTLRDALRNVAGISLAAGEGSAQGDNLTLRGFTARSDIFLDAMRDFGSYYRDPFNLEEIEVLKGPSGILFGRGSTGGVISQESKTPKLAPAISGTLAGGTDLTRRATIDINEPLTGVVTNAAFRLNAMANDAGVADRDVTENRRYGVAPSLTFGLGTDSRAEFSYFHQSESDIPDYGLPWMLNGAAPVARDNYYGFRDDFLRTDVDVATVQLEHDFNDVATLRDEGRYAQYARNFRITEPNITNAIPVPSPQAITIARNEIGGNSRESLLWDQLDAKIQFDEGFFKDTLATGIEGGRETSDPTRFNYSGVPGTSLENPNEEQYFSGTQTYRSRISTTANSVGLYGIDTLKLGDHFELSGGGRWDYFDAQYSQTVAPAANFDQVVEMPTWRGAIVYKPVSTGAIYFDYGTSFNPSAETLSLTAATASAPPEQNEDLELGSKWDFFQKRLSLRGALFRTDKTNAREPSPTDPTLDVLAGKERVQGIELEATGQVLPDWRIFASGALMESWLLNSQYYPSYVGLPLGNVPKETLSLWNRWNLPWHLEAGLGFDAVSSRTAGITAPYAADNQLKQVPGYWTLSAMLNYTLNRHAALQLNVYNLTDNFYYDQLHPAHIVPGPGRSALLSFRYKF